MRSIIALSLALPAALAAQSPALDAAATAMGGKERILAVRTLVLEGTGAQLNFGQNLTPMAETQFEVTSWRRSFDYANKRWFMDLTRVPKFTTGNMNPQRQRSGLDGAPNGVAYNIGNNDVMTRAGGAAATDRVWEFATLPIGFVQAANQAGVTATEEAAPNNLLKVTINPMNTAISMFIDARTNLPVRIERTVDQAMLGDVRLVTELSDYQDAGGIRLPMRIVQKYENLFTIGDIKVSSARVDADVGNIAATDSVRNTVVQAGAAPPAPNVAVDTIAPGVWRIAGGSHHTIAIEQSNRVVLVEAPQSDARTLAAIAKAREIAPAGKPVNIVVNTHHHFDHSGGFRAAVSEGLTVVTHQGNRDFYERVVFPRPHTINPDALQRNRKPLNLLTVGDRHTMRDGLRTIEIHHMPGNAHNGNMLVVYLPAEKILIQADLFNPPAPNAPPPPGFPFAANLVENVQKRGLQVERVVGIHGLPFPWADVVAAASANR
jgi:glyoxylase-like metal-dependent hydrolase (beta-lactamase superfamily II)